MTQSSVSEQRWADAQKAELSYWRGIDQREALRICAEKPEFLALLPEACERALFDQKQVLEIGCGPLGISVVSFAPHASRVQRLVKAEPLPAIPISPSSFVGGIGSGELCAWLSRLAAHGEYVQTAGERIDFEGSFDTVVSYNVLDHVRDPFDILRNAFRALRTGGMLLVGVDCMSLVGRARFEMLTRRLRAGSVLVEAHPHTFQPADVKRMIERAGFSSVTAFGTPTSFQGIVGRRIRPAFVATKR